MNFKRLFLISAIVLMLVPASASAAETIGGDQAWFTVYCNVDGASVYFDGTYKGDIVSGSLSVPVYTTGTPYQYIMVEKSGYTTWSEPITNYPAAGETVSIYATLNAVEPTVAPPIGGDMGYYTVYCNVDGADVYFNSDYKGQTSGGELTVSVYVTGTPYTTYSVQKSGYTSFTAQISDYPQAGETVKLYSTLNPVSPTPTQSPLSALTVIGGVVFAGLCLLAIRRV